MEQRINLKRQGLLDNGTYRLRIDEVTQKPGNSGYPYLNIKYTPIVNGQPYGVSIWDIVSLSPQSRFILDQFLDSIGAPNEEQEVSTQWFKGKFVWANLETEEYRGKLKNVVKEYLSASVGERFLEAQPMGDTLGDEEFEKPAKSRGRASSKTRQAVAEMAEEEFPV